MHTLYSVWSDTDANPQMEECILKQRQSQAHWARIHQCSVPLILYKAILIYIYVYKFVMRPIGDSPSSPPASAWRSTPCCRGPWPASHGLTSTSPIRHQCYTKHPNLQVHRAPSASSTITQVMDASGSISTASILSDTHSTRPLGSLAPCRP